MAIALPFQFGQVLLRLPSTNANLLGQRAHRRKASAVLAGVPGKPPVGKLGTGRHQTGQHKGLGNEDARKESIRIE
jgi:hypothetical protein